MAPINVNQPLQTVTARMQSCRTVVWAIDTYGDPLVDKLDPSFTPLLGEGQVMPFETQLELFKKKLILDRDPFLTSSLRWMFSKWVRTVTSAMHRRSAISAFSIPWATSAAISTSRSVSAVGRGAGSAASSKPITSPASAEVT